MVKQQRKQRVLGEGHLMQAWHIFMSLLWWLMGKTNTGSLSASTVNGKSHIFTVGSSYLTVCVAVFDESYELLMEKL